MSIKYILILTVLMSFGGYKTVQAETLRGMRIPDFNITAALGRWYVLISTTGYEHVNCSTITLASVSGKNFSLELTSYVTGVEPSSHVSYCTLSDNSNVIVCNEGSNTEVIIVIFMIEYKSYLAMYMAPTLYQVENTNDGDLFVLTRRKGLPGGVYDDLQNTIFFSATRRGSRLYGNTLVGCP